MRGPFLSYLASFGVILLMAIALPGMAALNRSAVHSGRAASPAGRPPAEYGGVPAELLARGFPVPALPRPALPPAGLQPPVMSNSITLEVKGLNDQASGKQFGDRLTELVQRISGGYQISFSGGGGRSHYSISMQNAISVQAFADQITWARVARVSGQTIEIDASSAGGP